MASKNDNGRSSQRPDRVRTVLGNYSIEDPAKANAKREKFLALLKSRYGYTNETSIDEIKRLLKQFYTTNQSLNVHRPHPIYRHSHAE